MDEYFQDLQWQEDWRDEALRGEWVRWDDVVNAGAQAEGVWERRHDTQEARLMPFRRKFLVLTFKEWLRGLFTGTRRYAVHYYFVFHLGRRRRVMFREEIAQL
jgi:hypothetical protein